MELGKVFSTLALLGYIFNFSILYSNYAIEAIYSLKVFTKRVHESIDLTFEKHKLYMSMSAIEATIIDDDFDPLASFRTKRSIQKMNESLIAENNKKANVKLDHVFAQWNVKEDQDTGEDLE